MASMVAQFSATNCTEVTSPVLDKVSRKKRKFRAETPQSVFTKNDSLLESYFPRQFPVEEPERIPSHCERGVCKVCGDCDPVSAELELGIPGKVKEESSLCIPERGDWDKSAERELRKLVLSVMDATLKSAIKKIVDYGYSEKVATKAIMRPGICYGSKDTLSNIVDNSLTFLQTSQDLEHSVRYRCKDLDELKDYLLTEFVYALQAVRPIFSTPEALWYLLFFDIDVSHACFVIGGQYKPLEDGNTSERSSTSSQNQLNTPSETLDFNLPDSSADIQPELPVPLIKEHETFTFTAQNTKDSNMGKTRFTTNVVNQLAAGTPQKFVAEGKLYNRESHPLGTLKNVSAHGKKWIHVGKGQHNHEHKGTYRTSRMPRWKSVRVRRTNCTMLTSPDITCTASFSADVVERPFSPGLKKELIQASVASHSDVNNYKYNECSTEEIKGQQASPDLDTEIIYQLTTRSLIWQNNLKEWSEWANTKVLQATRRLLKNKPELNKLRQEKAETQRLEQERKSLKQNIAKKLTELGNAVYKTSEKVNFANSAIRRLETENALLRQEMEVAQLQAAKSAANCQEAFERERERLINVQTCMKQKGFLQDDLNAEKLKLAAAQQELRKATDNLGRLEVQWSKETKAKQELLRQATSIRDEVKQLKASGKLKEEAINSKTASTFQKYKDDVQELQREISKLRLKSDSTALAVLRRGTKDSHLMIKTGLRKSPTERKAQNTVIAKYDLGFHTTNNKACVVRHRECVMCLEDEMSVVFLPCAHQVLCTKCNDQHKKNGFKDCPSCRSTILQRIEVRYAIP